jgi:hypothetical protein
LKNKKYDKYLKSNRQIVKAYNHIILHLCHEFKEEMDKKFRDMVIYGDGVGWSRTYIKDGKVFYEHIPHDEVCKKSLKEDSVHEK